MEKLSFLRGRISNFGKLLESLKIFIVENLNFSINTLLDCAYVHYAFGYFKSAVPGKVGFFSTYGKGIVAKQYFVNSSSSSTIYGLVLDLQRT